MKNPANCFFSIFVLISGSVFSQVVDYTSGNKPTPVTFDLVAGISKPAFENRNKNTPTESFTSNASYYTFQTGLACKARIKPFFALAGEVNYRQKNADLDMYGESLFSSYGAKGNFNLGYLSLVFFPEIKIGDKYEFHCSAV